MKVDNDSSEADDEMSSDDILCDSCDMDDEKISEEAGRKAPTAIQSGDSDSTSAASDDTEIVARYPPGTQFTKVGCFRS